MGVRIDEPGRDDMTVSIDYFTSVVANLADARDLSVGDTDVGAKARHARSVNHRSVANNDVVLHRSSVICGRRGGQNYRAIVRSPPCRSATREYNSPSHPLLFQTRSQSAST